MSDPLPVRATGLSRVIDGRVILHDLTFEVHPGEVVGLLGLNGAGKTSLLECLLGLAPPTQGEISVLGEPSVRLSAAAKSRIGFVSQQDELVEQLDVRAQLALHAAFQPRWDPALADELRERWNLPASQRIRSLSVGERQKLAIVLALGHAPDLLVLDEPVASLDPLARQLFLREIVAVVADGRRSVLFSSHIVQDVERLANHVWILRDGAFAWQGEPDALKESRGGGQSLEGLFLDLHGAPGAAA